MGHESDTKGTEGRDAFWQMFEDATKRKFDLFLVWAIDRLTREDRESTFFQTFGEQICLLLSFHSLGQKQPFSD